MLRGASSSRAGLFSLLGMFIMISANNFLVIYLGLELLTLSAYALVALRRDHAVSTEAAMKYFVLGAMASGFLLYGMSMLYGATGSLDIGGCSRPSPRVRSSTRCWCSAWCSWWPAWPSSWAPCPSTCGCPTSTRARPPRSR
jgi:NADH-quinone oxidoreductase subunit N